MADEKNNKYRASARDVDVHGAVRVSPLMMWRYMAMDCGAYNENRQKRGRYELIGFNDLMYLDDDAFALCTARKVRTPEGTFGDSADGGQETMHFEERLRMALPVFLSRPMPEVRLSESLNAIFDLARLQGYLSNDGAQTPKIDVWRDDGKESLAEVGEFLGQLREYYRSKKFVELVKVRADAADNSLGAQLGFIDALLAQQGRFHTVVFDLGVEEPNLPSGLQWPDSPGGKRDLLNLGDQLMRAMQFIPGCARQCLGAICHLENHLEHGQYLRVKFFLVPGEMGFRLQFYTRVLRIWRDIAGNRGWGCDVRGSPNKLVSCLGAVSLKDHDSVVQLRKAITFGVMKDLHMRVESANGQTFRVSEVMPDLLRDSASSPFAQSVDYRKA